MTSIEVNGSPVAFTYANAQSRFIRQVVGSDGLLYHFACIADGLYAASYSHGTPLDRLWDGERYYTSGIWREVDGAFVQVGATTISI